MDALKIAFETMFVAALAFLARPSHALFLSRRQYLAATFARLQR